MIDTRSNKNLFSKFLAAGAVGMLLTSSGVYAAGGDEPSNRDVQAASAEHAQPGQAETQHRPALTQNGSPERNSQSGATEAQPSADGQAQSRASEEDQRAQVSQNRQQGDEQAAAQQAQQSRPEQPAAVVSTTVVAITPVQDLSVSDIKDRPIVDLQGDELANVKEVVVRQDGSEAGVVAGVGGFFGIGEREVFISLDQISASEEKLVLQASGGDDALENMPEYDENQFIVVPEEADA